MLYILLYWLYLAFCVFLIKLSKLLTWKGVPIPMQVFKYNAPKSGVSVICVTG